MPNSHEGLRDRDRFCVPSLDVSPQELRFHLLLHKTSVMKHLNSTQFNNHVLISYFFPGNIEIIKTHYSKFKTSWGDKHLNRFNIVCEITVMRVCPGCLAHGRIHNLGKNFVDAGQ